MTAYNPTLDAELISLIKKNPHNFMKVLKSKGLKTSSHDNSHLVDYIHHCTSSLVEESKCTYKMKTLLFWTLNHISNWNDNRVKCQICGKPLYGIDVDYAKTGYKRHTCGKACERKMAQ